MTTQPRKKLRCDYCPRRFWMRAALADHMERDHPLVWAATS